MHLDASTALAQTVPSTRRGVVLVNVGTPDDPGVPAVRRYLREFLSDPHVIDLPAPARWALLNFIILPFRPKRSAHAYQQIWSEQGSPLLIHSQAQARALAARLPEAEVVLAMRYGNPSLTGALETLKQAGVTDVTLVPMYPQEANATSGTTIEAWERLAPGAHHAGPFFANDGFLNASAERVKQAVAASQAEFVLFSYHGLPVRQVARACGHACGSQGAAVCGPLDEQNARCYRAQCYATSRAIALRAQVVACSGTSFQSRLKGATWISPFTDETLVQLAQRGIKRVAVSCPSFVADCLETLEEIGQRGAETFKAAGGEHLELVPAVNDAPSFIEGLAHHLRARWSAQ